MARAEVAVILFIFFSLATNIRFGCAQSMAPEAASPAGVDCVDVIFENLIECLDFVIENSTVKTPPKDCCTGLTTILDSNPICLCTFVGGGGSDLVPGVNQTRSLELPSACNVTTPDPSRCPAGGPAGAPAMSPGDDSPAGAPPMAAGSPVPAGLSPVRTPSSGTVLNFRTGTGLLLLASLFVAVRLVF